MKIQKMSVAEFNKKYGSFFKEPKKGKNKFNAVKIEIGDKKFDSTSEGNLFYELELQKKQGLIKDIECQAKEELWAYGVHICDYYVDFKIIKNDNTIEFIEHKSPATATSSWRIKHKMLEAKYKDDKNVEISINLYQGYFVKQKK